MDRSIIKIRKRELCWMLIFNVHVLFTQGQSCDGIAREGFEYTLSCNLDNTNQGVFWQFHDGTSYRNISSCDSAGRCTDLKTQSFRATCRKTADPGCADGKLEIISVSREQTRFKCVNSQDREQKICNLQIYVKPDEPTCQTPTLTQIGTGTYINVTCSSEQLYPKGNCTFTFTQKGLPSNVSTDVHTTHSPSTQNPQNFRIQCSWVALLSGLSPTLFQVHVEVYPHLQKWVEAASTSSDLTPPTLLSFPTVDLADNCPSGPSVKDGYISAGTQASCKCVVTATGYPPGRAQWYTAYGAKVGTNENDGSASLSVTDSSTDTRYTCQPLTVLSYPEPQKLFFNPIFAVGPTNLIIDISDKFPLCPSNNSTLRITCRVPQDKVVPQPIFTITINNKAEVVNQRGQLGGEFNSYFLSHPYRPVEGGVLNIHCKATNQIFKDKFFDFERSLPIEGPPNSPPVFKTSDNQPATGSNIAYVTDGSTAHLKCVVNGGYPDVTSVTIICGNNRSTMNGLQATISVTIPSGSTKLLCHCSASHVTGCYNKQSEIVLTLDKPENSVKQDNVLQLGLGVGLGVTVAILIVIVFAFIVVCKCRRHKTKANDDMHYSQPDFSCNSPNPYDSFVTVPERPQLPQHPPPQVLASQSDYDLISLHVDPFTQARSNNSVKTESTTDPFQDNDLPDGYVQPI
uniref:Ig-like domain-containing protein n=1 Tax=Arion vulgaris TaxID=1028688 RepID=A0A0B7AR22_9EUPU